MVAGFDAPTRGRALFNGEPVLAPDPRRGVVFQESALFPWYTVRDNLASARAPAASGPPSMSPRSGPSSIRSAYGFESHYPAELWGG